MLSQRMIREKRSYLANKIMLKVLNWRVTLPVEGFHST
jgi:hypothetical protein